MAPTPINITYSIDGGTNWNPIALNQENNSGFDWTLPDLFSNKSLVKITALDLAGNLGNDTSNNNFTISNCNDTDGDNFGVGLISGCLYPEEDCDNNNPTIRPLRNNTENLINTSILVCRGIYLFPSNAVTLTTNNIYIDCNNSATLKGPGSAMGITANDRNNTKIMNCNISNFLYDIYLTNSDFTNISNNVLNQSDNTIYIVTSNNNTIDNNILNGSGGYDIGILIVTQSEDNTFTNNVITNFNTSLYNSGGIIFFATANNSLIEKNNISYSRYGIALGDSNTTAFTRIINNKI
jgi:parallel beta-helix repeat protein